MRFYTLYDNKPYQYCLNQSINITTLLHRAPHIRLDEQTYGKDTHYKMRVELTPAEYEILKPNL